MSQLNEDDQHSDQPALRIQVRIPLATRNAQHVEVCSTLKSSEKVLVASIYRALIRTLGENLSRYLINRRNRIYLSSMILSITTFSALVTFVLAISSTHDGYTAASNHSLQACLASKSVPLSLNSSSDWASLIDPYNLRLKYIPTAVTLPSTPQQVSDIVVCAAAVGVKVQARSGGHSYGSFSLGGKNDSLVVDLRNFNTISLDNCEF
jgi:hypothetical protein